MKVMVSGNGGDELLAGLHPLLPRVPQLGDRAAPLPRGRSRDRQGPRPLQEVRGRARAFEAAEPGDESRQRARAPAGGSGRRRCDFEAHKNLNERLASDVLQYSTPDLLRYEDKNSMAFSIEVARAVPRPRARRVHLLAADRPEDQGRLEPRGVPQRDEGPHAREEPAAALEDRVHEPRHHVDEGEGARDPLDLRVDRAREPRPLRPGRSSSPRGTSTSPAGPATGSSSGACS